MKDGKRIIKALCAICCALVLCGCAAERNDGAGSALGGQDSFTAQLITSQKGEPREFIRAVWVSYIDLADIISADAEVFERNLSRVIDNLASIKTTDVYLQVRAFGETLYKSEFFPDASSLYGGFSADVDYLARFIQAARQSGMRVHAWINPYRLGDVEQEPYSALALSLAEKDKRAALTLESGSFINPASAAAREVVVSDIASLCAAYDVDGVQFDDYFYPFSDAAVDEADYAAYKTGGGALSLEEWRRENVSALISDVCGAVRASGEGRVFGVSPDASIERNIHKHYADVELWCAGGDYIDYICPQIYYGYENETRPFTEVVSEWKKLCGGCELVIGLSAYKTGVEDAYAGSGALEWRENFDIISRQYADARADAAVSGAAFFRYGSLFAPAESVEAFAHLELHALRKEIDGEAR